MNTLKIMSVIGSAVPQTLRARGVLACWYLVHDGEPVRGPFSSLIAAQAISRQFDDAQLNG